MAGTCGECDELCENGLLILRPQGLYERAQFLPPRPDDETRQGFGPAVEPAQCLDRGPGQVPDRREGAEAGDVLGFPEADEQVEADGDGGHCRTGPGQLPRQRADRLPLSVRQRQRVDGKPDHVRVPVRITERESAVHGGGVAGQRGERIPDGSGQFLPRQPARVRSGSLRQHEPASYRDPTGGLAQERQGAVVKSRRSGLTGEREVERVALFLGAQRAGWDSIP